MKVLLATNVFELDERIKELVGEDIEIVGEVFYLDAVRKASESADVVVMSSKLQGEKLEDVLYFLRSQDKRVILLAGDIKGDIVNAALAIGIYDILADPVKPEDVIALLQNPRKFKDISSLLNAVKNNAVVVKEVPVEKVVVKEIKKVTRQQTIVWWSANGGEGKTTLAVMQGKLLAKEVNEKVALLDFKEVTPHIHKFLGIQLQSLLPVYEAMENDSLTADMLMEHMESNKNLYILNGVSLNEFDRFRYEHFDEIIKVLQKEFAYIIIDTNPGIFFSSTFAALKNADIINVTIIPNLQSIEDTNTMIGFIADRWNIDKNKIHGFLNMVEFDDIDVEVAENILGIKVKGIRYDKGLKKGANKGKLEGSSRYEFLLDNIDIAGRRHKRILRFLKIEVK